MTPQPQEPDLKEENKPGCFGSINLGRFKYRRNCRNGNTCPWEARCKQSGCNGLATALGENVSSRPTPSQERIGSIRINIFMDEQKEWLIERVNAGMGEWEYVISYLGEYFATAPSESIAREIQEAYSDRSAIATRAREDVLDIFDVFLNSDDRLTLYKWEVREKIRTLRTEGGEPR